MQKEFSMSMDELLILRSELQGALTKFCSKHGYNFDLKLLDINKQGPKLIVKVHKNEQTKVN